MARTARDARCGEPKRPVHVATTEAQPKAEERGKLASRMMRKCPVRFGGGAGRKGGDIRPRLRPTLPHFQQQLTPSVRPLTVQDTPEYCVGEMRFRYNVIPW